MRKIIVILNNDGDIIAVAPVAADPANAESQLRRLTEHGFEYEITEMTSVQELLGVDL